MKSTQILTMALLAAGSTALCMPAMAQYSSGDPGSYSSGDPVYSGEDVTSTGGHSGYGGSEYDASGEDVCINDPETDIGATSDEGAGGYTSDYMSGYSR